MNFPIPDEVRCAGTKRGRFAALRCALPRGHAGPCNFVVAGVTEDPQEARQHSRKVTREARAAREKRVKK